MIGRTVGNYVIQTKVGQGGMGAVYVAVHPHISRRVAVKVLHPGAERTPEMVHRFFNEARAASDIRNEHIVEVLDFGELPEKTPYLVMEWLEGQNLGTLLKAETKLPLARVAHIVRGIVRALKAAHGKGVVHRDLKPDNVFLVRRDADPDFVKVLDFGIAKLLNPEAPAGERYQTQTGAIIGTPQYMSPEQCRGAKEIDHRTDIYSLGVIAYQMLAGRLPFLADSLGELLFKHLSDTPPSLTSLEPSVPPAVAAIVARALDKLPEKRPSLSEIAAVMEEAETGAPASGPVRIDVPAPLSAPAPSGALESAGPSTTLGGSASELGLERVLAAKKTKRSGLTAAALLIGAALVVVLATRKPGPPRDLAGPVAIVAPPAHPATVVPAPPAPAPVQIEIRTVPETAALTIDGEAVANPFVKQVERDGKQRVVNAALSGYGSVRQDIVFDRDRTLVLTLAPAAPSKSRPAARPATGHGETAGAHDGARPAGAKPGKGYRGSNLDIETDFPAGSR